MVAHATSEVQAVPRAIGAGIDTVVRRGQCILELTLHKIGPVLVDIVKVVRAQNDIGRARAKLQPGVHRCHAISAQLRGAAGGQFQAQLDAGISGVRKPVIAPHDAHITQTAGLRLIGAIGRIIGDTIRAFTKSAVAARDIGNRHRDAPGIALVVVNRSGQVLVVGVLLDFRRPVNGGIVGERGRSR